MNESQVSRASGVIVLVQQPVLVCAEYKHCSMRIIHNAVHTYYSYFVSSGWLRQIPVLRNLIGRWAICLRPRGQLVT